MKVFVQTLCRACQHVQVSGPNRESYSSQKQVALLGFAAFIFFFMVMHARSTNVLIISLFKSLPAQFLSWCITRDLAHRIRKNEFGNRLTGIEDEHRKESGDTVSAELIKFQHFISTGLFFCAIGDFCLSMELHPKWGSNLWFLIGLISFLVGHVFFIMGMQNRIKDITASGKVKFDSVWALPLVVVYILTICYLVVPHISDVVLQVGVMIYACVIGTMAYNSIVMTVLDS